VFHFLTETVRSINTHKKTTNANETNTKGGSVIEQSSAKILRNPGKANSIIESEAGSTHEAAIVRYEVLKGVLFTIQDQ